MTMLEPRTLTYQQAMVVDLPPIDADGVVVKKFTVSKHASTMDRMRSWSDGGRWCPAGEYTRLTVDGTLWMSDTPDERRDHAEPWWQAQRRGGRILVHGLGLGMFVGALLRLDNVEHIDVVENDPRIIEHIAPHYASDRLTVHEGDAYTYEWPVGMRWSLAFHDVWPTISAENWDGMKRLHRRFGRRVDWQTSWCRSQTQRLLQNDKRWMF